MKLWINLYNYFLIYEYSREHFVSKFVRKAKMGFFTSFHGQDRWEDP